MWPSVFLWPVVFAASATVAGELETIVVTGTRQETPLLETPVATEVIDGERLRAIGAENAAEALATHPGVQLERSFNGTTVQLQGLSASAVLVLIDGQRQTGKVGEAIDLSRIAAERIERIEIVKGAASALYGADAVGGVINVITKRAKRGVEARGHLVLGSRLNSDLSGEVGLGGDLGNLRLTAGWHRGGAYDLDENEPATNGSAFDELNLSARGELNLGAARIHAQGEFNQRALTGVDANTAGAVFDRHNRTRTYGLTIGPDVPVGDTSRLSLRAHLSAFGDDYLLDQRGSAALDQQQRTDERLYSATLSYLTLLEDHAIQVGVEGLAETLATPRLGGRSGDRQRASVYAQDEWQLLGGELPLILVPGARLDVDSQFGGQLTPKLALRVDPLPGWVLRLSYGRGFKAPTFRELLLDFENPSVGYRVEGNPELRPERSTSLQLSSEWSPVEALSFNLNVFRHQVDDIIQTGAQPATEPGAPIRYLYVNVAQARVQGLEASLRFSPRRRWTWEAAYTFLDAVDQGTGERLAGRPRHRVTSSIHLALPTDTTLSLRGAWTDARAIPVVAAAGEAPPLSAPAYLSGDLRVEQGLPGGLAAFVGVDNLFAAGDAELLPLPPRTFYGGLNLVM